MEKQGPQVPYNGKLRGLFSLIGDLFYFHGFNFGSCVRSYPSYFVQSCLFHVFNTQFSAKTAKIRPLDISCDTVALQLEDIDMHTSYLNFNVMLLRNSWTCVYESIGCGHCPLANLLAY